MASIKNQLLKSFIKINVLENLPGMLKIHIRDLNNIKKEIRIYDQYVIVAIELLKGIQDVTIDYQKNTITILYDKDIVRPQLIYKWLHIIIDVAIDNLDFIKKYSKQNILFVEEKLTKLLQNKLTALQAKE